SAASRGRYAAAGFANSVAPVIERVGRRVVAAATGRSPAALRVGRVGPGLLVDEVAGAVFERGAGAAALAASTLADPGVHGLLAEGEDQHAERELSLVALGRVSPVGLHSLPDLAGLG